MADMASLLTFSSNCFVCFVLEESCLRLPDQSSAHSLEIDLNLFPSPAGKHWHPERNI